MKEHAVCSISDRAWLTVIFIIVGTSYQAAHVKTAYNIPYRSIEATFNQTVCFSKECSSDEATKLGRTLFWTFTVIAEPLGAIPAFLTGRNVSERLGRKSLMFLALLPICGAFIIQALSQRFISSTLIPLGRLFHSFGATWLLIGGITFVSDLVKPALKPSQVTYIFSLSLAGILPLIQILTLPEVFGTKDLWPWLNAISAVMLLPVSFILIIVPEPPRYLYSIGAMEEMHESLDFYNYSKVMSIEMYTAQLAAERSSSDWDRKQSFSALKVVRRHSSKKQLDSIYAVIICNIVRCVLMSNVIYVFLDAILQDGMGLNTQLANLELISAFGFGFLASVIGLKTEKLTKSRTFIFCTVSLALLCYVLFASLGFFLQYMSSPPEGLHQVMYISLLIFFPTFNMGLTSVSVDIVQEWLIPAAQGPTLALAMAVGKFWDLLVSAVFFPVFQYQGLGFAWLSIVLPLLILFPLLIAKLPRERRIPSSSAPQIPLVIQTDISGSSPQSSSDLMDHLSVPKEEQGRKKSNTFSLGDEKVHANRLQALRKKSGVKSRSRSSTFSPGSKLEPELAWKLQLHSKSNYLQKQLGTG